MRFLLFLDLFLVLTWGFMIFIVISMVVKQINSKSYESNKKIPHKCEHCQNTFYLHANQQEMINGGGTVECPFCHKWSH